MWQMEPGKLFVLLLVVSGAMFTLGLFVGFFFSEAQAATRHIHHMEIEWEAHD